MQANEAMQKAADTVGSRWGFAGADVIRQVAQDNGARAICIATPAEAHEMAWRAALALAGN